MAATKIKFESFDEMVKSDAMRALAKYPGPEDGLLLTGKLAAMAAGGLVALLGATMRWQLIVSALIVIAGVIVLRRWKNRDTAEVFSASLDIGQPVRVIKWNDNGSARVFYRGAEWDAEAESAETPHEETLYIAAVRGSGLILTHHKSAQH